MTIYNQEDKALEPYHFVGRDQDVKLVQVWNNLALMNTKRRNISISIHAHRLCFFT